MSDEKKKSGKFMTGRKNNVLVIILSMIIAALIIALAIMVMQYHQLTADIISNGQKKEAIVETDTEMNIKMELQMGRREEKEENTKKSTVKESEMMRTERYTETQTEKLEIDQATQRQAIISPEETQMLQLLQTETQVTEKQTITPTPETQVATQVVHTAKELTIADIPNSLYAKLKNPEELRTSLFNWLDNQGAGSYLYCSCDYDYTESADTIRFLLQFSSFTVEVTYNIAGNVYSYELF